MSKDNNNGACRLLPNGEIVHYDCTDYADGIVTKITNGINNDRIVAKIVNGNRVDR